MFVTSGQIYVFIACVAIGVFSGLFYSISSCLKKVVKLKAVEIIFDVLFFISMLSIYVIVSYSLNFPTFRVYMLLGLFLGFFAYLKSLHKVLAKSFIKLYNLIVKKFCAKREKTNGGVKT